MKKKIIFAKNCYGLKFVIWGIFCFLSCECLAEEVPVPGSVQQITTGVLHSCVINTDNDLYCWGGNSYGSVGNGAREDQFVPVKVMEDVASVKAKNRSTCAIKKNGDLYCWGLNKNGQVGNGSKEDQLRPVKILEDVASVSVGYNHDACAIKSTGELFCWGYNGNGCIGDGSTTTQVSPVKILDNVASVALSSYTTCAIDIWNNLYCWGSNKQGQVGIGTTEIQTKPVKVMSDVAKVSVAIRHTCAIKKTGELLCWGNNKYSQIGVEGTATNVLTPTQVLSSVSEICIEEYSSCAVTTDSKLNCWGRNNYAQMGDGTTTDVTTPKEVYSDIKQVVFGGNAATTCAIKTDDKLLCWGTDTYGQVGAGKMGGSRKTAIEIMDDVSSVVLDGQEYMSHTCAVQKNGKAYCWGENTYGEVGNKNKTFKDSPTKVADDILDVALGVDRSSDVSRSALCAIKLNGDLYCRGYNEYGQVGDGTTINQSVATNVLTNVTKVQYGSTHVCAITGDKKLYCWGRNNYGQVGNGSTTNQLEPKVVLDDVKDLGLGANHTCALTINDELYCWGRNNYGQIGNNSTTTRKTPLKILDDVNQIGIGLNYSCVITNAGVLKCWGLNTSGQIGNGTTTNRKTPYDTLTGVISMASNHNHSGTTNYAIKDDGSLYAWGVNDNGQVGNGNIEKQLSPVRIMENVMKVGSGGNHACVITVDNDLYCWGKNDFGQVGNGGIESQLQPVKVLENVASMAFGNNNTLAVTLDGKFYIWGDNGYSQVGLTSEETGELSQLTPHKVLDNIEKVNIGNLDIVTCAIDLNHTLWCWGSDRSGVIAGENNLSPYEIFDGGAGDPLSCGGCCLHWNYNNLNDTCTNGLFGVCLNSGQYSCYGEGKDENIVCDAEARPPEGDEICDGLDNDCDGKTDEDFPLLKTECGAGIGACYVKGEYVCKEDGSGVQCNATAGNPSVELCDGIDNDCDGEVDENFPSLGEECSVGKGACETKGVYVCNPNGSGVSCYVKMDEQCERITKDSDGDGIPDAYEDELSEQNIVRPSTRLLPPLVTKKSRTVVIHLEQFNAASLNRKASDDVNETKGVKWLYKVKIRTRDFINSKVRVFYKRIRKNRYSLKLNRWQRYRISYKVVIKKGKKKRSTPWSKKIIVDGNKLPKPPY